MQAAKVPVHLTKIPLHTLKMEAACSPKMLVYAHPVTWFYIKEGCNLEA
jgi:hypothetical protein